MKTLIDVYTHTHQNAIHSLIQFLKSHKTELNNHIIENKKKNYAINQQLIRFVCKMGSDLYDFCILFYFCLTQCIFFS